MTMMGDYVPATAAHQAYVARKGVPLYILLELQLPSGTVYFSEVPFDRYSARIVSGRVTPIERGVMLESNSIPSSKVSVTIAEDDSRTLERLLEGGYECRRSPAILRRGAPQELLAEADWRTRASLILDSWDWSTDEPGCVTLNLRANDQVLRNTWMPNIPILKSEWGEGTYSMPDGTSGIYSPLVYGSHKSAGLTGKGFVPMPCVGFSGTTGRYLASLGRLKTKIGTWKKSDGSSIAGTMEYVVRGGKTWTTVNYGSGITAGLEIQGDFEGYDALGTGLGALITNPVDQLIDLMGKAYADWKGGNLPSPNLAPIEPTSFGAAREWCERFKIEGSVYVGGTTERTALRQLIEKWAQTFWPMKLYWNEYGKLAIANLALALEWPGYPTATSRRFSAESLQPNRRTKVPQDVTSLTRQVSGTYLYSAADGRGFGTIDVQSPDVVEKVTTSIQLDWSLSRAA